MNKILEEDAIQIINDNNGFPELKDSTFFITGASGMIGSYFINVLLKMNETLNSNINIVALVRDEKKLPDYIKNSEHVTVIVGDVVNTISYDSNIDYVIHAASPASPIIMKEHPVATNFANTLGTANTLMLAKEKEAKGFLFVSSREIYGQPDEGQEFFTENGRYGQVDPLVPRNGYAEGKKAAENMCVSFNQEYDLNVKIARLAHTYGPGMSIYDGRVQADFLKNVVNNEDIIMKSTGAAVRTYTYVSDAINAMFKILLYSNDIVYNIADEDSKISIRGLAEVLVNISSKRNIKLVMDIPEQEKNTGTASFTLGILSTEKIRKELDWKPKYNIANGFLRTIEYIESELEKEKNNKFM